MKSLSRSESKLRLSGGRVSLGWFLVLVVFWMGHSLHAAETSYPKKGMILLSERPEIVDTFQVRSSELRTLFRGMVCRWTDTSDPAAAWSRLGVKQGQVVGVKINTSGGPVLAVKKGLVEEIASTLLQAGAKEVIVWDKYRVDMEEAGYVFGKQASYRVESIIPGVGFDESQFYVNEYLGRLIWGDHLFKRINPSRDLRKIAEQVSQPKVEGISNEGLGGIEDQTSNKSFFTKMLTERCDKIVNVATFMDHETLGVWGTLSSLAVSSVDNTRRFTQNIQASHTAIGEILDRDLYRKKVILHVVDGTIGQFAGGPFFTPHFAKPFGIVIMGNDPVAMDTWVLDRIQKSRSRFNVVPIEEEAKHLDTCAKLGLGEGEFKRIKVSTYP